MKSKYEETRVNQRNWGKFSVDDEICRNTDIESDL